MFCRCLLQLTYLFYTGLNLNLIFSFLFDSKKTLLFGIFCLVGTGVCQKDTGENDDTHGKNPHDLQ